ncbi:hypothetical protein J6590_002422 [Homalodisca vitripennis]|nr:hypothetical protein J6590_002422 [Homalodisca vitripennis]
MNCVDLLTGGTAAGLAALRRRDHGKDRPYECLQCGRRYQSKASLSLHTRLECGKEPQFQCVTCLRRFHQGGSLNRHIRALHPTQANLSGI